METLSFQVAEFDAPLDLILHLISKHKLDIMDIDILSLVEQYIETINTWKEKNLDVASEFLEMASRLVHMKTVSLLPHHEDESEKLRRDLSGQLMEYKICKLAARMLQDENSYSDIFVREPMEIDFDPTYKHTHSAQALYNALIDAIGKSERRKPLPQNTFDPIVARPVVSVTSKIFTVLRALRKSESVKIDSLFDPEMGKSGLVATFLAVLELMKSGKIFLENNILTIRKAV